MTYAIEAADLQKTYAKRRSFRDLVRHPFQRAERVQALRGVDFNVAEGEIFGLLGPNGAGKTTLLKIFSCLVFPDHGQARIAGIDTLREGRVKSRIGLVHSDERSFYWRLTGRENLRFFATLYNLSGAASASRITELLHHVEMTEAADQRFSEYSSGMKQRLAIARALLHDPPILLMDEPTRSLDPAAALHLREFIRTVLHEKDHKTILLASHNLREVEALCDRVAILVKGKVRTIGTVAQVRRYGEPERRIQLDVARWPASLVGPFRTISDEAADGMRRVVVALDEGAKLDALLRAALAAGVDIHECRPVESDLEDAFSRIVAADA